MRIMYSNEEELGGQSKAREGGCGAGRRSLWNSTLASPFLRIRMEC